MASSTTRDAWIGAATALGLGFTRGSPPTGSTHRLDLEGTVGGFPVTVKARSSDKSQWTDVTITTEGLPPGFAVRRRTVTLVGFLPRRGVKTGDIDWDATMVVKANEPGSAQAFLSPERRRTISDAVSRRPRPRIKKGKITITHQGIVNDEAVITAAVRRLVDLAEALDLTPPTETFGAAVERAGASSSRGWTIVGWVLLAATALTWIFGAGTVKPVVLIGVSAVPLLVASLAFTRGRRG